MSTHQQLTTDRPAEIREPLLAVADTAGGHWPDTARNACRHFVLDTGPQITSTGVRLLADLRHVFTARGTGRMTTADILTTLHDLEESNWADLHGKPLDARRLGRKLGKYGVKSKDIKIKTTPSRAIGQTGPADLLTHGADICRLARPPRPARPRSSARSRTEPRSRM